MIATELSPEIWNAIAGEIRRSTVQREIVFATVTKVDTTKLHLWCAEEFGDTAIPLVGFTFVVPYYDSQSDGTISKRSTTEGAYIVPAVGETVAILDVAGARSTPICIGILLSKPGFWED